MKYIIGNWKMNGSAAMAAGLLSALREYMAGNAKPDATMAVCPPSLYLPLARDIVRGSIALGAQDCHEQVSGAFTGNISAPMIKDSGGEYVLVGHSERRQYHGETDALIGKKLLAAQAAGLTPVLCIGETLSEREGGKALSVLTAQLGASLAGVDAGKLIVAYEPVWAIGTGKTATTADIEQAHAHIRAELKRLLKGGEGVAILYGGSVNAANAAEILAARGVDGALVGGASLKAEDFCRIYDCA